MEDTKETVDIDGNYIMAAINENGDVVVRITDDSETVFRLLDILTDAIEENAGMMVRGEYLQ